MDGTYIGLVSEESSPSFYPTKLTMVVMWYVGLNSGYDLVKLSPLNVSQGCGGPKFLYSIYVLHFLFL
jgi:hypothetical protein